MTSYVLVTGASSGIGLELAKIYAKHKRNLILVARRKQALEQLASHLQDTYQIQVHNFSADLRIESECYRLFDWIHEKGLIIQTCINNAGLGANGAFLENQFSQEQQIIRLNMESLVLLSKLFLKHAQHQKEGHLIQIASIASFFPGPYMAVYYASKAFVMSFSKAIRHELKGSPYSISVVCPGPTKTEFQDVAGMQKSTLFTKTGGAVQTAEEVAIYTFKQAKKKKFLIVPGILNRLSVALSPIIPNFLSNWMISRLHH
jgi:short-subunit dehydrogenase